MSRDRKPVALQSSKMSKAERESREKQENKNKVPRDDLLPPAWLNEYAAAEFKRVVDEAGKADFIDNLDLSVLAIYCDSYARYIEATTYLQEHGMVTVTDKGYPMTSPYMSILNQSAKNIFSCSTKLGLATTDRLKLVVPTKEEVPINKFLKYLGGADG